MNKVRRWCTVLGTSSLYPFDLQAGRNSGLPFGRRSSSFFVGGTSFFFFFSPARDINLRQLTVSSPIDERQTSDRRENAGCGPRALLPAVQRHPRPFTMCTITRASPMKHVGRVSFDERGRGTQLFSFLSILLDVYAFYVYYRRFRLRTGFIQIAKQISL